MSLELIKEILQLTLVWGEKMKCGPKSIEQKPKYIYFKMTMINSNGGV